MVGHFVLQAHPESSSLRNSSTDLAAHPFYRSLLQKLIIWHNAFERLRPGAPEGALKLRAPTAEAWLAPVLLGQILPPGDELRELNNVGEGAVLFRTCPSSQC